MGYKKKLLSLLTPPTINDKYSHWSREDKIVISPPHLKHYLKKSYCELIL